jgi:hypothetical protein
MRDPIWFKEFEREYNEREDHLAELKEKYKPAKKEWLGLMDEEIESIYANSKDVNYEYERAIEAKLKEKNT